MLSRLFTRPVRAIHRYQSRHVSIDDLRTVCLMLGPYRNLTTLTASLLFLHPACQVLNHAGSRIFGDDRLDFLGDYSDERFAAFCRYAIHISARGERGSYGGSITRSHAFDDEYRMAHAFKHAALPLVKARIVALFWKESLLTSNHLRDRRVDLDALFARNRLVRFLLPIRHPLDCAVSNMRTGNAAILRGITKHSSLDDVCHAVLDEMLWFKQLEARHPDRFVTFFEYEPPLDILLRLAAFLELAPEADWLTRAFSVCDIKKKRYEHSPSRVASYRAAVEQRFAAYPDFARKLLAFADEGGC